MKAKHAEKIGNMLWFYCLIPSLVWAQPSLLTQPRDQFLGSEQSTASLYIRANRAVPLEYQWFFNGEALTESTTFSRLLTDFPRTNTVRRTN